MTASDQLVTIGEGRFILGVSQEEADLLHNHDILNHGLTHLLNSLADLLAQEETLSWPERDLFAECFYSLVENHPDDLYFHLLDQVGPEGIGKNLWMRLAYIEDLEWPFCTDVFKDMPTAILEEGAQDIWDRYAEMHDEFPLWVVKDEVLTYLGQRADIYGGKNMPSELAFGILIEEDKK